MEKSCGIVLFSYNHLSERRFLVLRYQEGHWDFPKGHVEPNESEQETALRELFEETGIKEIDFIGNFRERVEYSFIMKGKKITKEVLYFLAKTDNLEQIKLSNEHLSFEWLSYQDAIERITYPNAKEVLQKAEYLLNRKN
ncbi:MAG: bis(5'-nucleosyl)-tetraphosphatase [Candidatus Bilamarchaeum sp.]|jgi:8-oxo-dGTP pyrophosphatase MutT (NUDIX family)